MSTNMVAFFSAACFFIGALWQAAWALSELVKNADDKAKRLARDFKERVREAFEARQAEGAAEHGGLVGLNYTDIFELSEMLGAQLASMMAQERVKIVAASIGWFLVAGGGLLGMLATWPW